MVGVGDGLQQDVRGEDWNAQPANAVGLHRESALMVHAFDDGLYFGTGLHPLVGGEVADVSGPDGQHLLAKERMLLVHHLLEHSCGIYSGKIVVFKGRHEWHRAGCHHKVVGIDVGHFAVLNILQSQPSALQQIPYGVVQQNPLVVVSCQRLCDVKTTHSAVFLLLFKEEELVGLHVELSADAAVVVNHQIVDAQLVQLFAAGKSRRTRADYGHACLVDGDLPLEVFPEFGLVVLGYFAHLVHIVNLGDADAADFPVNQHFAGSALADSAFQAAVTAVQTVTVDRMSGLMQGGCNGVAFCGLYFFSFKQKFDIFLFRNVQNGVRSYFIHI